MIGSGLAALTILESYLECSGTTSSGSDFGTSVVEETMPALEVGAFGLAGAIGLGPFADTAAVGKDF